MEITIKNLKFSAFATQETHCFEASVYVDGKRAFIASNAGHGGPHEYHPLKGKKHNELYHELQTIENWITENLPPFDFGGGRTCPRSLDSVITELVNDELTARMIKGWLKRITYIKDGEVYQAGADIKPTPANLEAIKGASWWKPEYVVLNTLPLTEAVKLVRGLES